ncbi:MAG TPA: hypothetical protein VHK68_12720 [Gemmatimonadales bacterium]|nr:hypothetical protein [Gemmatimonadales bacterium]
MQTLNSALGATIEEQVVTTLNSMRLVWDPDERYALYSFVRQAQTFPDVLLRRSSDQHILLGIELKGWYLLAKEGEPSFRFQVTPAACNVVDLVVVVPWALAQVISGSPMVFDPYIESARYAAEHRNYHWQHIRQSSSDRTIRHPQSVRPYPSKADAISDQAADQGGNFGRFARTGLMDAYLEQMKARMLAGLRVEHWLSFLKAFPESRTDEQIRRKLEALRIELGEPTDDTRASVLRIIEELRRLTGLS